MSQKYTKKSFGTRYHQEKVHCRSCLDQQPEHKLPKLLKEEPKHAGIVLTVASHESNGGSLLLPIVQGLSFEYASETTLSQQLA